MNQRAAIAWAFGATSAAPVCVDRGGGNAAGDALIELDRSLYTETEIPFCAFVVHCTPERANR